VINREIENLKYPSLFFNFGLKYFYPLIAILMSKPKSLSIFFPVVFELLSRYSAPEGLNGMNRTKCEWIRELIPDYAAGRLTDDEIALAGLHFADCNECRDELDLVHLVFSSRAMEPEGLAVKINAAVHSRRVTGHRQWWGAAAAAVALLAIGLNVILDRSGPGDLPLAESEFEIESENLWLTDDALIAGAPMLGGLSDEALTQLLEELTVGTSGGAA